MYKFRRIGQELGITENEQLQYFKCSVPPHLYLYHKDATTIKEAMENIKRACVLGGVSVVAPVEKRTTQSAPFMQMADRPDSRNEPSKSDHVKFTGLKFQGKVEYIDEILNKLEKMLDQQIKERESTDRDRRSSRDSRYSGDSRDGRDSSDSRDNRGSRNSRDSRRSYRSDSYSSSEDDRYRSRSRDRSDKSDKSSRNKSRNQSSRDKRNNSGTRYSSGLYCDHCKMTNHEILNCFKLQNTLKREGVALNEVNRKSLSELEKHQMIIDLKAYIDGQYPTN